MKLSTIYAISAACTVSTEAAAVHFLGRLVRDAPDAVVHVDFEVVKEEAFKSEAKDDCVCPENMFWHYRIKQCVEKGNIGYECGFFPAEHHEAACMDGLICKKLNKTPIKYLHDGAVPATCLRCETWDKCKESSRDDCAKVVKLSGEACATVRAEARLEHPFAETETESERATGKFTAKVEATATYGEGDRAITKTASAECTESAEASAKGSATAAAKEGASKEKTVCVSVVDAMAHSGHSKDLKFSESIADEVKDIGKKLALERAMAEAKKTAAKQSLEESEDEAEHQAEKLAEKKAEAEAEQDATAKAKTKAEMCASRKAKLAAEAAAKAAYEKQPASATTPASTTTPAPTTTTTAAAATPAPTTTTTTAAATTTTAAAPAAPAPTTTTTTAAATTTTAAAPPTPAPTTTTTTAAATTTLAATTLAATTKALEAEPTEAPEQPGPLLPGPPPKKIQPAEEPEVQPRRKVSKEEAAEELP